MSLRTVEMALATPGLDADGKPTRIPLGAAPEGSGVVAEDFGAGRMLVNIGPQHPATHGVLRLVLELEGETVRRCIPHLGYLHSGFEKLGEYRHYNQIIPLTDRTDYLSPMANNVGLAMAVEKLMGIDVTERCQVLRVIACEMSRIISHLVWLGTTGIDLGVIFMRELPGILIVLAYFLVLPPLLAKTVFRGFFIRMGFIRYMTLITLILFMASLPIKMVLRWTLNLKYIVGIPEYFFNI